MDSDSLFPLLSWHPTGNFTSKKLPVVKIYVLQSLRPEKDWLCLLEDNAAQHGKPFSVNKISNRLGDILIAT